MILKAGIGYGNETTMSEKKFKKICKYVAGKNSGKLKKFTGIYHNNFYEAHIYFFEKDYWVRLNSSYPFIGFLDKKPYESDANGNGWTDVEPTYVEAKHLADQFSPYYRVLTAAELNEPLDFTREGKNIKKLILTQKNELNESEKYGVAYFQPRTIGHIVFNHWD